MKLSSHRSPSPLLNLPLPASSSLPLPPCLFLPPLFLPACRFSTQDTFPGRGRWADPLQLVDGHWSPGGGQLAATDSAGQLHVWGLPVCAAAGSLARAPYDQFLGSDYGALVRDVHG